MCAWHNYRTPTFGFDISALQELTEKSSFALRCQNRALQQLPMPQALHRPGPKRRTCTASFLKAA